MGISEKTHRIGRIQIDDSFVQNVDEPILYELASRFPLFPLRSEHHFESRTFQIVGISPLFDEIADGELIPNYHFSATVARDPETGKHSLGEISVKRAK